MKNNLKKISAVLVAGATLFSMSSFAETKSLEDRVSELEANQSLNIFNFSGTLINRMDDILKASQTTPNVTGDKAFDNSNLIYMRLKFQLNMDANVSKYIKFYSRLTASKFYNISTASGTESSLQTGDLGVANDYESSAVYLEKAYVDVSVPDTALTFSVGRLPTVDGQPANYLDGRARMGTYPLIAYNSNFDGIGLTYRLDQYMPQDQKLALRVLYTPLSNPNYGTSGTQGFVTPGLTEAGSNVATQTSISAVQADYSIDNSKIADNVGIVVQGIDTGNIYINGAAALGAGNSSLSIGIKQAILATEFNGIAHTPFDLSASYLYTSIRSQGSYGALGGFGNSDGSTSTVGGGNLLLSARYRLPTWIFGAEYVNGSKNSSYFETAQNDLTSFYGTTGNAYHVYVTKKFTENLALRLGYMYQKYTNTPVGPGVSSASDLTIQTAYLNMRVDF